MPDTPTPDMSPEIAQVFAKMPTGRGAPVYQIRDLIFDTAQRLGVGPLTETLKWGEPAYLTEKTKAGSTIRLGMRADGPAVFFNCNTSLVEGFRRDYTDRFFRFEGNRALVLTSTGAAAERALSACIGHALTYHRDSKT